MGKRYCTPEFLSLIILALFLGGCAVSPPSTTQSPAPAENELLQRAQTAIVNGNLADAARDYLLLVDQGSTLKQSEYRLQAASLYLQANRISRAEQVLRQIEPGTLHGLQLVRQQLLIARIALINHRTGDALSALEVTQPPELADEHRAELYQLRAEAYERRRNPLKAVQSLVIANNYIHDPSQKLALQHKIWQILAAIPTPALATIASAPAPDEFTGWLELMRIAKESKVAPIDVNSRIQQWRIQFPDLPVDQTILDSLLARQGKVIKFPQHIALLLPFTGAYEKPAAVIRDGFLAAHYDRTANKDIQLSIYDSSRYESIYQTYQQAIIDGASFVVGPLIKDDVTALGRQQPLPIPVLTLNYGELSNPNPDFYQFGLAPEQEAQQAAERAWLDGNNRALVLTPTSPWGTRVFQSFAEHWEKLGGELLKQQDYPGNKNDFADQIQHLLELNESKSRRRALQSLLKHPLYFEPRRRQDADFIFMAAFPRQARLLRPQLKFHYASELPIYSTSHVFTGNRNRYKDRDMDDIQFCDMGWTLDNPPSALKRKLLKLWPEPMRDYARFFALGIDAYQLIPQLEDLRMFQHERFNGVTGQLFVTEDQLVARTLKWAQFSRGLPVLLQ